MRCFLLALTTLLLSLSASLSADQIEVVDDNGDTVRLSAPAQRIISLAPSMTELLFSLGAGDQVKGVVAFSDHPPAAQKLPVVAQHDRLDLESILALQPDLVVAWRSGNPRAALQQLRNLGITVYVAEPVVMDDIAIQLERLGELTGQTEAGRQLAADFRAQLHEITSDTSPTAESVRVFYQVWHQPVISVGGAELINDMIRSCGGVNIFADLPPGPTVDVESVLLRNPEVIIASGVGRDRPEWLDRWRRWSDLPATAGDHLYHIPPDLVQRHSLRSLQGLRQMCQYIQQAADNNPGTKNTATAPQ